MSTRQKLLPLIILVRNSINCGKQTDSGKTILPVMFSQGV